ncbi:unnamed protein product [Anisakis simplex]|uniref:Epidermal retinol dehydrogenase 2 (inferred by orthology to a human protein) n=1 Tax=Anisakis simplex TaxID=6269 RepID=A0A0M3KHK3_ANISI|nr:unnamed protein product [Anisakis simplex]
MFVLILRILYETLVGTVKALMPIGTMPRKSVRGQVVLITGSGSGIGRLMAVEFGQLGARLVLWDVNEQGNLETKKILEEKGIEVSIIEDCCVIGSDSALAFNEYRDNKNSSVSVETTKVVALLNVLTDD